MGQWHARIPAEVIRAAPKPTDVVVITVLYLRADRTGRVTIGKRQLAAETGLSRPTVIASVRRLEDKGLVTVEHLGRGSAATTYRVETVIHTPPLVVKNLDHYDPLVVKPVDHVVVKPVDRSHIRTTGGTAGPGGPASPPTNHTLVADPDGHCQICDRPARQHLRAIRR